MNTRKKIALVFLIIGLAGASQSMQAGDSAGMSPEEITACVRANVFDRGAVRDIQIRAVDREGKSKEVKFKAFWKPGKTDSDVRITMQVVEPESLKGTSYLLERDAEEQKLYLYLPALGQVRQVTGGEKSQKLWGSDLTLADLKQIQGLIVEGDVKRLADREVAGRSVYLLETAADIEQTGYHLVRSYVDRESCMLLKVEMFSGGEEPRKILEADVTTLMEIDPWWVILNYRVTDKQSGTRTEVALSDIYIEERLPGSLFTPEGFHIERK